MLSKIKSKKWFGIPIALIAGVLVAVLAIGTGVGVWASWAFNGSYSSSVTITTTGSNLQLFKDQNCTIAFAYPSDTLSNFAIAINTDHDVSPYSSNSQTVYIKNTGSFTLSPTISTNLSASGLQLDETAQHLGQITGTATAVMPTSFVSSGLSMSDVPAIGNGLHNASATSIQTQAGPPAVPTSGAFREDASGEIYTYSNIDGHIISGIVGGQLGTIDTGHADGTITFGTISAGGLAPGQVVSLTFKVSSSTTTPQSDNFNIVIASLSGS